MKNISPIYWTPQRIQREALKYRTMTAWSKGSPLSYRAAYQKNDHKKYNQHMIFERLLWTKEECWTECLKYKSIREWITNDYASYLCAKKNEYIIEFKQKRGFKFTAKSGHWNSYENCLKEALSYSKKSDWTSQSKAYRHVKRNNPQWIRKLTNHMFKIKTQWTIKECIEEVKKYKSLTEWKAKSSGSYRVARKKGIIEKCAKVIGIIREPKGYWTYNRCKKESIRYKHKSSWLRGSPHSYNQALQKGWLKKLSKHMLTTSEVLSIINTKWTLEKCKKIAKKYKTRSQWQKGHISSYHAASRRGWLEICASHTVTAFKWDTKEKCLKEARKYKRKTDWIKHSKSSYIRARKKGWHKECTAHMKQWRTLEDCQKDALKYKSKTEWLNKSSGAYWSAYSRGFFKKCTGHMIDQPNQDLREKRALKRLIKLIKTNIKDCILEKEIMIGRNSFPDLVMHINNKVFIIELKHDDSQWKKIDIQRQIEKYKVSAKIKYGDNLVDCLVTSPKGRYGLSFKDITTYLQEKTIVELNKLNQGQYR